MTDVTPTMDRRLTDLERALRRTRWLTACAMTPTVLMAGAAFTDARPKAAAEVRTQRLVVVDEQGQTRVVIGQDATTTQRVSRAAGLTLYDEKGSERGGFSTMSDGSVVLGMDAPAGVGAPMRDRIGLKVHADGSSYVMLIDNKTSAVARLVSNEEPNGDRGVQVFKQDPDGPRIHIRSITYDGDTRRTVGQ
jgi:hypothetical protein